MRTPATRQRAGLPSRRHYRYAKVRRKVYQAGSGLRVKVRKKLRNWWSAGASLEVLRWIREGVRLEWEQGKAPPRFHQGCSFRDATTEERAFVQEETTRLLASGAVRVAKPGEATHVSQAFLVPKSNGKFRMIWDGRKLNEAVRERKLSFETLRSLKHLAQTGDWMLQVDLTDGFHILGIHEMDVPKMAWQCGVTGETYLYQVLPFGYALSPYAFCTTMSVFTRVLRSPDVSSLDRGKPESLLKQCSNAFESLYYSVHCVHGIRPACRCTPLQLDRFEGLQLHSRECEDATPPLRGGRTERRHTRVARCTRARDAHARARVPRDVRPARVAPRARGAGDRRG